MAAPVSFRPILSKYLKKIKPKHILEWGPGVSTLMMNEICPGAEVTTIEHQEKFWNYWLKKVSPMTMVVLIEDDEKGPMENYSNPSIKGEFDLIFVDGRKRVKCMKFAKEHLSPDGVLILHDSEREEYKEGIELFDFVEENDGTTVLKKPVVGSVKDKVK